jgi:chromosome segregation ATPase
MARAGILYSHVASAATQLTAQGINPTVDNVREALGNTGSKSTIAPLLKRWKTEQEESVPTTQTGLPADLVAAVRNLHEHIQHQADQKVDAAMAELQQHRTDIDTQLETARDAANTFKNERNALDNALTQERKAHEKLGAAHHDLQVTQARLEAEASGLTQRLQERRIENDNLQQQLHQARAQFEHYQEAVAAQRDEERRQFEQAKAMLETEIGEVRRQLTTKDLLLSQQQQQIAHLQQVDAELRASRSDYQRLQEELLKTTQTLSTQTALATDLSNRFDVAAASLSEVQNELAILENERPQLQSRNLALEGRLSTLEESCQTLRIEKATLEGQLQEIVAQQARTRLQNLPPAQETE